MKDFNIAKYLKEHSLGSHGILGKYVDLHPLKEEETNLGQQKAMKEPYEGPEDPIDGLGGKLNRHMDVSMNEMDGDNDEAKVEEAEELDMNEYDQLLGAIENLLRQGETPQNILRVVKDTLGMNEGMEDDSFIQAQRDAVGAKGSSVYGDSESEYYNRMMDLIDTTLEPQLPKVKKAVDLARQRGLSDMAVLKMLATNSLTRGTIKNLIDDGFDPQDIVDFFATDFSMQEDDINLADLDTEDVGA